MAVPLEKFVKQLEDSGIIAGDTLKDFLPPKSNPKDAEELALELVRKKKLTKFQAEEVSKGKGKSLVLGNYVLMEKIGAGGMGQVFKARHRRMNRLVAVKLLPVAMTKDAAAIARFEREVTAAAKLRHPNIVAADDADCANGVHFLVMELVDGSDLSALVKKNGLFPVDKAVNYILQASKGLEFAHKKGIVHRDIKPANLLLDTEGTVKILDMGLARLSLDGDDAPQADLTNTGTIMGTVDYMAPEQALDTKTADARADIYALGCSLYYMLTGKATYDGDTLMKKLLAHREHPIPSIRVARPDVPEQLEGVFKKMVAKKIEDRYQTMTEVIAGLEGCGSGLSNTVTFPSSDAGQTIIVQDKSVSSQTATLPPPATDTAVKSIASPPADSIRTQNLTSPPVATGKNSLLKDRKKLLMIGGAVMGVMILLAGVVINMKTKGGDGTLVVTVSEPDAEVQVLNEKDTVEITRKGDQGPITITVVPGKHRLKVQKDGFEIFTDSFEIKSGKSESIAAKLVPVVKATEAGGKPWKTPAFEQWVKDVQAMPAEKQVEAVRKKLMELNPGFDGKLSGWWNLQGELSIEDGAVTRIGFSTNQVTDISPVRAFPRLKSLGCYGDKLTDLSPLTGMPLDQLACIGNPITDISPLKDMPLQILRLESMPLADISVLKGMKLKMLRLDYSKVSDLSPLTGMPLDALTCSGTRVADLSPIKGIPLRDLNCAESAISDFSPLEGMPLLVLYCRNCRVSDLSPLQGMQLTYLEFTPKLITRGIDVVRQMKTITGFNVDGEHALPPDEFWKKYDSGEFGNPTSKPLAFQTPGFDQWVKDVQSMPAEKQVEAVSKKLVELNPGFDGKMTSPGGDGVPKIANGIVTEIGFVADHVTDISPVRALVGLKVLRCYGSELRKGKLSDLSPLKGMSLSRLNCWSTQVSELSPLEGMPLDSLECGYTMVADLSPVRRMRLSTLLCDRTKVSDLSPLRGMPLDVFFFDHTPVSDISPLEGMSLKTVGFTPKNITLGIDVLRQMKTVETIGIDWQGKTKPDEFWKKYGAGEFGKPEPAAPDNK